MLRKVVVVGVFLFVFASVAYAQSSQEQLTITTYYPAPYGSYRELHVINNDQEIVMGEDSTNPGLVLRDNSNSGTTPYINFNNDDGTGGFDMRIILDGDDLMSIRGGVLRLYDSLGDPGRLETGEVWFCTYYN